jgi:hypothetical protein
MGTSPAVFTQRAHDLQDQRWQKNDQGNQMQIAPLTQALQADRTRLAMYADANDPTKAQAGKEKEYEATADRMAQTIGQMRTLLGQKQPSANPNPVKSAAAHVLDRLHITNDLQHHLNTDQQGKQTVWQGQNQTQAKTYAQGIPPPEPNAVLAFKKNLTDGGFSPEDADKAARIHFQMEPKPVAETSDTRARKDFTDFQKDHPEYKGSFEQWKTEQSATGRNSVPKPKTFDQKYQDVLIKQSSGQPLTADDKSLSNAWDLWNKKKNIEPGVARAAAYGANRYIAVVDPSNPENVTMMRAGEAARSHAGTPASIGFQTDKALTRAFTSGAPAANITAFNTASGHLKMLQQAGDALRNGDVQLFNRIANSYATATGEPAPTNFNTVKAAVAGELAKTFKGSGATDQEIGQINSTINTAESPEQIQGAIGYYTNLMDSKLDSLKGQYESGKEGKPNFSGSTPEGPKTQQLRDTQTSTRPPGATGRVMYQGKKYWIDKDRNNLGEAK